MTQAESRAHSCRGCRPSASSIAHEHIPEGSAAIRNLTSTLLAEMDRALYVEPVVYPQPKLIVRPADKGSDSGMNTAANSVELVLILAVSCMMFDWHTLQHQPPMVTDAMAPA